MFNETMKFTDEQKEWIIQMLYRLDWIKILYKAVNNRKTSWNENPVCEWRNASDEVLMAMMTQVTKKLNYFPFKEAKKRLEKLRSKQIKN